MCIRIIVRLIIIYLVVDLLFVREGFYFLPYL
nr:MAG TPA: hypothetical protein [Caudoviricetes sp.]